MIDHYVVFRPFEGSEKSLSGVLREFSSVISSLDCVLDITWGENTNPLGLKHGYTHGCFVRLTGEEALRSDYWNHPAHQKLLGECDRLCADRFVVDYLSEERKA
jgi:hypothetical protein